MLLILSVQLAIAAGNCDHLEKFTDTRDKREYKITRIGEQVWMAENLKYDVGLAYCYGGMAKNCDLYGRLYNAEQATWACPRGWRLPAEEDWKQLLDYLGGGTNAAARLKATGTLDDGTGLWKAYGPVRVNNETCFSALPGGEVAYRSREFLNISEFGNWWTSSTRSDKEWVYVRMHYFNNVARIGSTLDNEAHFSVRCIKTNPSE